MGSMYVFGVCIGLETVLDPEQINLSAISGLASRCCVIPLLPGGSSRHIVSLISIPVDELLVSPHQMTLQIRRVTSGRWVLCTWIASCNLSAADFDPGNEGRLLDSRSSDSLLPRLRTRRGRVLLQDFQRHTAPRCAGATRPGP